VAVDATSAAGGLRWSTDEVDVYYFAPQKCLASDGGLWLAACSPAAIERIERIKASDRWIPASIDLGIALDNSRLDQTYNTPALATIFLAVQQIEWINHQGGLRWAASRCDRSAEAIYGWADASDFARPFVEDPAHRSHVVATIDLDDRVEATTVSAILRANGIVDTDSYRKLGRNQLRIALFPAIEPDDVVALTKCIDHVVSALS
jgi:phosphoserine aminotransferase